MSGGEDASDRVVVALRLYVAADSAPSMLARRQLELVRERLGGEDWEVEVVDVFKSPEVAAADRSSRPLFWCGWPSPRLSVIGDLEITESGMRLLGLIRGVRGILSGLAEVTPDADGAEGGQAGVSSLSEKDTAVAAGSPVAEQSLRTVIRENVDGMLVIDREGVVVFANPAAERLLGRPTQALKGTRFGFPHVPGESSEIDVVAGPRPRTAEMRVVAIGWEGQPAALASLRDVTERKRVDDQLRRLSAELELRVRERTAQLEAAVGELEAFNYSISHDVRAPLRAIHGFATILEDQLGDDLPPEALHSLDRVKTGAKTIGTLIDELQKLSRLGRQPLLHTTVDLSAQAHEIVAELRRADPERDVDVSIQQGLRVTGDEQLLRIALVNLLGNAFKFTRHTTNPRVEINGRREGENLSVQVRDNGAGFDPEYADRLFRPFQRLHAESEFAGTGIGLTTVQRVISRNGGSITASGAVGRGASFSFTLPAATEPEATRAKEAVP